MPVDAPRRATLVDDEAALPALLARLDALAADPVSLDTEADSFHHYFEKVCLVQVAVAGEIFLVDRSVRSRWRRSSNASRPDGS